MALVQGSPTRPVPSWAVTEPDVSEALSALENYKKKDPSKGKESPFLPLWPYRSPFCFFIKTVVVRFKAVGNAPIMRQRFYKITASNRFQAVIQFLRKELGWKAGEPPVSFPLPFPFFFLVFCERDILS